MSGRVNRVTLTAPRSLPIYPQSTDLGRSAQLVRLVPTAVIHSVPDTDNQRISGSDASRGRWGDIQGGVFDDLAARTAEISAKEQALRPVVFGAEWR
jgi:hypothetical protein